MERVDGDEDVSDICVDLISGVAALKLVCHRVLKKKFSLFTCFTRPRSQVEARDLCRRLHPAPESSTAAEGSRLINYFKGYFC